MWRVACWLVVGLLSACGRTELRGDLAGAPDLFVFTTPDHFSDDVAEVSVLVTARDALGDPGVGNVRLTTLRGQVTSGVVVLDATGVAVTRWRCTGCRLGDTVTARWVDRSLGDEVAVEAKRALLFTPSLDSGTDAGVDAGFDAGVDAGFDAGVDAGFDAGVDAGFDAGVDAGFDAGVDAGRDAGFDGGTLYELVSDTQWRTLSTPPPSGWLAPGFTESGWGWALINLPRPTVEMAAGIWDSASITGGSSAVWFRREFTLATPLVDAGIFVGCDDDMTVWFDGQLIVQDSDGRPSWERVTLGVLPAGQHVVGAVCRDLAFHRALQFRLYGIQ